MLTRSREIQDDGFQQLAGDSKGKKKIPLDDLHTRTLAPIIRKLRTLNFSKPEIRSHYLDIIISCASSNRSECYAPC